MTEAVRLSLAVVGDATDTDYIHELRSLVLQCGLDEEVSFLPPVPEAALPKLFRDYDIFVFPSLYEPFSLTLIHAMASGIPTVASTTGGNVELVTDEQTGLLFAPGDAARLANSISRLTADGPMRERISTAARAVAKRFTIDSMVARMETYLAERM
jgi:glycosyltransferase involved in cell wall biosynthesis